MKRAVAVAALSSLAVAVSPAFAAGLTPETGAWKGTGGGEDEIQFKLAKTGKGYEAGSARIVAGVPCDVANGNPSTVFRNIRERGITVPLRSSGNQLRGSRTVKRSIEGGKATDTVKITATFVSARQAKVAVRAKYDLKRGTVDDCEGRTSLTAKPK